MATVLIDNKKIYWQDYGKGDPVVLIAGLGSDSSSWLPIIIPLSKKYRVIVFDNIGVGRSDHDNKGISVALMADCTRKLITKLNLNKPSIIGHSMGGMIAIDLAVNYPKLLNKLVLVATSAKISKRNVSLFRDMVAYLKSGINEELWVRYMFYWIFSSSFFENPDLVDQAVTMAVNYRYPQSIDSFENQVEAIVQLDMVSDLNRIKLETLVLKGDDDLLFTPNDTQDMFNSIMLCTEVNIEGSGHSIHMDKPDIFLDEVKKFIG